LIAYAINSCHKKGITLNDINYHNIGLNRHMVPTLINFESAHFGDDEPKRRCGMKGFIAPEIAD